MCGEHCPHGHGRDEIVGSSPRVWGACNAVTLEGVGNGIIPTCVGSMLCAVLFPLYFSDHPHVCGEHSYYYWFSAMPKGSSPRVWGASFHALAIIGEEGSSPRVWGALMGAPCIRIPSRIIPTCVGSIYKDGRERRRSEDHPHVCGEHELDEDQLLYDYGSSPRVWGAYEQRVAPIQAERIIPTCVGSIWQGCCIPRGYADHPHVCGEHPLNQPPLSHRLGSSPRVWGACIEF